MSELVFAAYFLFEFDFSVGAVLEPLIRLIVQLLKLCGVFDHWNSPCVSLAAVADLSDDADLVPRKHVKAVFFPTRDRYLHYV